MNKFLEGMRLKARLTIWQRSFKCVDLRIAGLRGSELYSAYLYWQLTNRINGANYAIRRLNFLLIGETFRYSHCVEVCGDRSKEAGN